MEEVKSIAELLNIADILHKMPRGNESQRPAEGCTHTDLGNKTAILLLDEPLSNQDAAFRADMRIEPKRLHHDLKQTTIYVTHDQIEAMSMVAHDAANHLQLLRNYDVWVEFNPLPEQRCQYHTASLASHA
jgi:ABC-type sugar transport system ATPase subunit